MGRISRLYPKGRLRLRTPKTVQSGKQYPLYIEYCWQADTIRKSTGLSVTVKEWNEKGYCGVGEIRATTTLDYKYYNNAQHKRIEDIDVMTLRLKDIDFKKKVISKVQVKTRNRNSIPLSEPLIHILDKWKDRN